MPLPCLRMCGLPFAPFPADDPVRVHDHPGVVPLDNRVSQDA